MKQAGTRTTVALALAVGVLIGPIDGAQALGQRTFQCKNNTSWGLSSVEGASTSSLNCSTVRVQKKSNGVWSAYKYGFSGSVQLPGTGVTMGFHGAHQSGTVWPSTIT